MAVTYFFATIPLTSPANIPKHCKQLIEQLGYFKLSERREERNYRRWVKPKPSKYPSNKNKNASQLN